MAVFLISAYQESWAEFAQSRLFDTGLGEPRNGRLTDADPWSLTDQLCQIADGTDDWSPLSTERIGKAWEFAASDLILSNCDVESWGWAHRENLRLLDYWMSFDPSTRYLLVYGSPESSLAQDLSGGGSMPTDLQPSLDAWEQYHRRLLSFFMANQETTTLVHIGHFESYATKLRSLLVNKFGFSSPLSLADAGAQTPPLHRLIAREMLSGVAAANALYDELEHVADLPAPKLYDDPAQINKAAFASISEEARHWDDHEAILEEARAHADSMAQQAEAAEREVVRLQRELDTTASNLSEMSKRLESAEVQKRDLTREMAALKTDFARSSEQSTATDELNEEIQILRLQLEQSNEELESYFRKYNDLKRQTEAKKQPELNGHAPAFKPAPAKEEAPSSARIDMRTFVKGRGWHSAEGNGRWAGDDTTSTIDIPALQPGDYELELNVIDAMALDIAKGLDIEFNGAPLNISQKILSNMSGNLAPLRRLKASLDGTAKPYPIKISARVPSELLTKGNGQHRLTIKSPRTVSPAASGSTDTRELSIFVESVELTKVP